MALATIFSMTTAELDAVRVPVASLFAELLDQPLETLFRDVLLDAIDPPYLAPFLQETGQIVCGEQAWSHFGPPNPLSVRASVRLLSWHHRSVGDSAPIHFWPKEKREVVVPVLRVFYVRLHEPEDGRVIGR